MKNISTLVVLMSVALVGSAQFVNPFLNNRNEFNQKDFISVFNHPDVMLKQQLFGYDWVQAFNQQAYSTIVPLSGVVNAASPGSGYIAIETANFNEDEKDDIFYLIQSGGAWKYGATYQDVELDQQDSLFHFANPNIPTLVTGASVSGDYSYPNLVKSDLNGDGIQEMVCVWSQNDVVKIQIIRVTDGGGTLTVTPLSTFDDGEVSKSVSGVDGIALSCGDLDGDGNDEIIISALENSAEIGVDYNAFVKVYDVSADNNFTITPKGRLVFNNTDIGELDEISDGGVSYARTSVQAIRNYPTTEPGGTHAIFAALALDRFNEGQTFDYLWTYTLTASSDLNNLSVVPGPVVSNNGGSYVQINSPCESHVGDINGDTQDDVVLLTSGYVIFTYENNALVVKSNGAIGPVMNLEENPMQESNDRFEIGDVDRNGRMDIVSQTKIFTDEPDNGHRYYLQVYSSGNNNFLMQNAGTEDFFVESGYTYTNYGFALGNLDGNDLCLGEPNVLDCDYYKPIVILEAVPIHFDIVNGTELDINDCYELNNPNACENLVSFTTSVENTNTTSVTVSSDWAVSTEASADIPLSQFAIGASLGYTYGERFEQVNDSEESVSVSVTAEALTDDFLKIIRYPLVMHEYPVLGPTSDTISWIVAAFPNPDQGAFQDYTAGRFLYNYLPNHEIGNVLSYPKPNDPDLFYDASPDPNWLIWNGFDNIPLTSGIGLEFSLTEEASNAFSNSSTTSQTLSSSIGGSGFGIGAKVSGEYTEEETQVFGQTVSEAESYTISPASVIGDGTWDYDIVPVLYWTRERAAKLGMSVDLSTAGPFWENNYGQQVDPALNLPFKYSYVHFTDYIEENLDRTKSIRFNLFNPNPGDTITAFVRIFNYSMMDMTQEVPFSLYLGHPDQGGTLIPDLDGNTLFSSGEILDDQGRAVQAVSFVTTNEMIEGESTKIYVRLDPQNVISEIHEDNNTGWAHLGLACNTPDGTVGIDDISMKDGEIRVLVFPNPATDHVTINFSRSLQFLNENLKIRILDISGNLIMERQFRSDSTGLYSFNVGDLAPGVYLYQIASAGEHVYSGKLIIQ